jgi:hypothetical protein
MSDEAWATAFATTWLDVAETLRSVLVVLCGSRFLGIPPIHRNAEFTEIQRFTAKHGSGGTERASGGTELYSDGTRRNSAVNFRS